MDRKPLCFVIMGFGKKVDPYAGRTLDLDKSYKNIIQPVVESNGYECVRADEIKDSGLIDKSMYALLIQAELVIADISTYNPNAIYELGVRHAAKPFSTIIIKEEETEIPFDIDHNRIFPYKHLGDDIGATEAERCQKELNILVDKVKKQKNVDSPLYEYITDIEPPILSEDEYNQIVKDLADREKHIFAITVSARDEMKNNNFEKAAELWKKASEKAKKEPYFIQQFALCTYKSKEPSEESALTDALGIIQTLNPDGKTNDPETLGITGAIYKRLWKLNKDQEFLKRAIKYYGKCFKINSDYYTGENFALCLNLMAQQETDQDEETYYKVQAKKVREEIIQILNEIIEEENFNQRQDKKWIFATLSHCYYAQKEEEKGNQFEDKFREKDPDDWEIQTYEDSKQQIAELIE